MAPLYCSLVETLSCTGAQGSWGRVILTRPVFDLTSLTMGIYYRPDPERGRLMRSGRAPVANSFGQRRSWGLGISNQILVQWK